jgi:hypothetical protein
MWDQRASVRTPQHQHRDPKQHQHHDPKSDDRQFGWQVHDQNLHEKGPWWPPAPSYAPKYTHGEGAGRKARRIVGSERASRRREMSRPRERWPIVLKMRNGKYYLTVVPALIDRRRIRPPPSSPSSLGLAAIDALYPKRCPKHGKAFASMLAA